jgi:hypothetical protein
MKTYNCKTCGKECLFSHQKMNVYCSNKCQAELKSFLAKERKAQELSEWINGKAFSYKNFRRIIKEYLIEQNGYKCSCCGISSWNGKDITLWVDHIDGNATNNCPSNFRLICPNCDSQSDTFGAKNYGKGRKARGLPQYG